MSRPPLAVYVHVPFCVVKCGYCDFNAYAGMDRLKPAYTGALIHQAEAYRDVVAGREVSTLSFGGGTPGEMPAAELAAVVAQLRSLAVFAADAEVSLEANPGTTTAGALSALVAGGFTRVSFGAQSFDAAQLRFLDRAHSVEQIGDAVRAARSAGFASVNLDVIYGLPGQDQAQWQETLERALALSPDHLSLYALTVEEGTPLAGKVGSGALRMPEDDAVAELYELATDVLAAAGFEQYELSNWALPGHASRHNRAYWTDQEYLALGAGAHGYLGGERYENVAHPRAYIEAVGRDGRGVAQAYRPGRAMAMSDWLMLSLRLLEGFAPADFEQRFGMPLETVAGQAIATCIAAGLLEADGRVRLTRRGHLMHGEVVARLAVAVEDFVRGAPVVREGNF